MADLNIFGLSTYHIFCFSFIALLILSEIYISERKINRKKELHLDILSCLVILISQATITKTYHQLPNSFIGNIPHLFGELHWILRVFLALLVCDYGLYLLHYVLHKYKLLWSIHLWHHSPSNLYWFSGFRASFIDHAFVANIKIFVGLVLFQLSPLEIICYFSTIAFFGLSAYANIKIGSTFLELFVVTPRYHRIHHSATTMKDYNLASIFTIWDRLFGKHQPSNYIPKTYQLGLEESDSYCLLDKLVGFRVIKPVKTS